LGIHNDNRYPVRFFGFHSLLRQLRGIRLYIPIQADAQNISRYRLKTTLPGRSHLYSFCIRNCKDHSCATQKSLLINHLKPYNPLVVADGGLPEIAGVGRQGAVFLPEGPLSPAASYTYAQICAAYGIARGDELHVVCAAVDPVTGIMSSVLHSCIIMEPASGDMSTQFVLERGGAINSPNAGNYGDDVTCYWLEDEDEPSASFRFQYVDRFSGVQHIAGAIVRAHQAGSLKQWSPAVLKTVDDVANVAPLGAAVATYMGNSVYLNGV
jgi:hypothetical protein